MASTKVRPIGVTILAAPEVISGIILLASGALFATLTALFERNWSIISRIILYYLFRSHVKEYFGRSEQTL